MTRCARERRVFFFEEPVFDAEGSAWLRVERDGDVSVATPHLASGLTESDAIAAQRRLLDRLIDEHKITASVAWYYTPDGLAFSDHLSVDVVVFDCMDELSAFAFAPKSLRAAETALLARADVVFTGGHSLFEAKRGSHHNIHLFPSSVDVAHFRQARGRLDDTADQQSIPHPRLGFYGVIDERMDLELVAGVARARPDWHLILLGPVVKIDPASLPTAANIHYLGMKQYDDLPRYIASWDVALLPFARNQATRFISPTKTPEYLAAGKPVVSTSIRDVVRPYAQLGLVRIADRVEDFVVACAAAMADDRTTRMRDADAFLRQTSWDGTWAQMRLLMEAACADAAEPAVDATAGAQ